MGFGMFSYVLILSLFCNSLVGFHQEHNSDEFSVLTFFQKMGISITPSVPLCSIKGIYCDENNEFVLKLEMSGWGLSGRIPRGTVGKLRKLDYLDLSNNRITHLPDDFWDLGSLKYLNLSFNRISGTLPDDIANFFRLRILDLSFNYFYGGIPEAISSLDRLKMLSLRNNRLDSMIPLGIFFCRSLVYIDLSSNNINSTLHNGFGSAFLELRYLNLADNQITGRAADLIGLSTLRYLNVSRNKIRGSVVGVFQGEMEVVDLSRNYFQGLMAQVKLGSTFDWPNLVYLDISENQFSGEFSDHLSLAMNLKYLNLAHNRFSEQGFLKVDNFSSLEYLNLSSTSMIGPISTNISRLSRLRVLDLSHNHLSSRIPPVFTDNLRVLDLSYNNLSGNIPYTLLQQLQNMYTFNFSLNSLNYCTPQFPGNSSFIGLTKNCPIATNPVFVPRKSTKHKGLKLTFVLTLSLSCFLLVLLFVAFGCRYILARWHFKPNPPNEEPTQTTWVADISQPLSVPVVIFHKPLLNFTFSDLLHATSNFDRATLLAEGRFGPVYRGLLPGGLHVAIKVLDRGSTMSDQEAARELDYLGRIKHHNLVPLTGYCVAGVHRIAIYEYMENGNLQNLLHDLPLRFRNSEEWEDDNINEGITSLNNWSFRHKVVLGTARALAFLHHGCSPPIIHRDVKASSVYLDSYLEPRLSDFGLAKIFGNGLEDGMMARESSAGYLPPEFSELGSGSPKAPTPKSDVYGFGVVLLELITGKKPVGDDYPDKEEGDLVSWIRGLVRRSQGSRAIDPKIRGTGSDESMVEGLKIGYLCTAEIPSKRPSMHQVVGLLKDIEPSAG